MTSETYYQCAGCAHATFRLSEAIQHYAEQGARHTIDNAPLTFIHNEWDMVFDPYKYDPIYFEDDGVDDQVVRWA